MIPIEEAAIAAPPCGFPDIVAVEIDEAASAGRRRNRTVIAAELRAVPDTIGRTFTCITNKATLCARLEKDWRKRLRKTKAVEPADCAIKSTRRTMRGIKATADDATAARVGLAKSRKVGTAALVDEAGKEMRTARRMTTDV